MMGALDLLIVPSFLDLLLQQILQKTGHQVLRPLLIFLIDKPLLEGLDLFDQLWWPGVELLSLSDNCQHFLLQEANLLLLSFILVQYLYLLLRWF